MVGRVCGPVHSWPCDHGETSTLLILFFLSLESFVWKQGLECRPPQVLSRVQGKSICKARSSAPDAQWTLSKCPRTFPSAKGAKPGFKAHSRFTVSVVIAGFARNFPNKSSFIQPLLQKLILELGCLGGG